MDDLIQKINNFRNKKSVDLSMEEDLSIGIMNLISLEEHFFFTAQKTKKDEYLKFLSEVREIRKKMLAKMMPENEGETWCISKHLLSATMRFIEVGTKFQNDKKESQAKEMFESAYKLYNLFWGVRLKLIDLKGVKKKEIPWNEDDIVAKLVDCCRE